jgi:peptidoglycan biosynthesis protein MviN/MurJ (putative lipid II flippase)
MALVAGLIFTPLRAGAFGLATAVTSTANALVLIWVLRGRWGQIGFRRIVISLLKTAAATAVMGGAVTAAWRYAWPLLATIHPHLVGDWTRAFLPAASLLGVCVVAGILAYFLASHLLRCPELRELLTRTK